MGNILAIAKKELRISFTTVTAYAVMTVFALITAFFFLQLVSFYQMQSTQFMSMGGQAAQMLEHMNFNDQVITPLFSNIQVFFLFLIPMMTMRLLADEQRMKTMQLLMTTPVRPIEIVLGKYIAAAVLIATMLGITILFPLILQVYGAGDAGKGVIDWRSVMTGYLGLFLVGAAFVAIGLFTSSVTDSAFVAVALSFGAGLLLRVVGWAGIGKEGFWHDLPTYLSLLNHLEGFAKGVIRLPDLIYYASLIVLGLFLTHRMVEAQRWR